MYKCTLRYVPVLGHNFTVVCKNNVSNAYVTGISKVKLTTSGTRKSLKMIGECAHIHCTIVIRPKTILKNE